MSEKPLHPWIIAEQDGCILAAHCTCTAGLGEACTHVTALLCAVESSVKLRDSKTVTDEKSYWLLPASVKGVWYKEIREMDFTSAKTMKKILDRKHDSAVDIPSSRSSQKQKTHSRSNRWRAGILFQSSKWNRIKTCYIITSASIFRGIRASAYARTFFRYDTHGSWESVTKNFIDLRVPTDGGDTKLPDAYRRNIKIAISIYLLWCPRI